MKKRGVSRKIRTNVYRSNHRTGVGVRPALIVGGIIAVIVIISLANWLYRVGAFASTGGVSQAQVFTDATALIAQTNGDIQAVASLYEDEIAKLEASYQAEIDDLNGRIEEAIAADSVVPLTSEVTTPTEVQLLPSAGDALNAVPDSNEVPVKTGFWSRVGQFFANLFN